MPNPQQRDRERVAITINAQRMTEIATLRRECAFWRQRCLALEAVSNPDGQLPRETTGEADRSVSPNSPLPLS